ncbi:MAG: hypothetical protein KGI33_11130 [Thaumarchaeota archaeon]|nr:hypothetical protein [Nitrososphaerota archaeon]
MVKSTSIQDDGSNADYAKPISFITILVATILILCHWGSTVSWQAAPISEQAISIPSTGVLTLQVTPISPNEGETLVRYPSILGVKVTRGGLPVEGARIQFWMEGGPVDAAMHNAGLSYTDSSGMASLVLPDQNTLDAGHYLWYATALKPGFKGGSSPIRSFSVMGSSQRENSSSSGGVVSTDQATYYEEGKAILVRIHGRVGSYHMGEPIILKIRSPSGNTSQLVAYGAYLGGFQTTMDFGSNPPPGLYQITVYHGYILAASCLFYIME